MAKFQPGQSGNPNGRPKKQRALTDLLEKAGSATIAIDGQNISGKRLMARMVWQGVLTGHVEFPDGKKMRLSPTDWKAFVQWIYTHIDGPPRAELDITSQGEKVVFEVVRKETENSVTNPTPEASPVPEQPGQEEGDRGGEAGRENDGSSDVRGRTSAGG